MVGKISQNGVIMKRFLLLTVILSLAVQARIVFAGGHYVSPDGRALWDECVDISRPCSLSIANQNAQAGDTVYLRGGVYNTHIFPRNSGTDVSHMIVYTAYRNEEPAIRNTTTDYATYYHGILLEGRSYIKIEGITVGPDTSNTMNRLLMITKGGSYNEISHCNFYGHHNGEYLRILAQRDNANKCPSHDNWIHDCIFADVGHLIWNRNRVVTSMGFQVGIPDYDCVSGYNTIEHCVFYSGGHHDLNINTKHNIIRDNFFYNIGSMPNNTGYEPKYGPDSNGLWGHRNISIYDGFGEDKFNLLERNRFGPSGAPPENDGGDGLTVIARKNIIRYNSVYSAQNNGVLFKIMRFSRSDENRFYNNTVYASGRYHNTGPQWQGHGIRFYDAQEPSIDNVLKNNIVYNSASQDIHHVVRFGYDTSRDNIIINNWFTSDGDPLFLNGDTSDPTSQTTPDFSLQKNSPCIDKGTYLTKVSASDAGKGIELVVEDALYFQDGSWGSELSDVQADWIAIGTIENVVQIDSIDYKSNTITLKDSVEREAGDPIWLYKDSRGMRVLYGSAPDIGAYEYVSYADEDVNQDGKVNIQDVHLVVNVILGTTTNSRADVNGDEIANVQDVQEVVNVIVG